ncbi:hypothetical protein BDR03DRAFT_948536 [Suillus americanus]|nr:hypothetical protein BDR03DRAFT_948536 [Suillus americanus]
MASSCQLNKTHLAPVSRLRFRGGSPKYLSHSFYLYCRSGSPGLVVGLSLHIDRSSHRSRFEIECRVTTRQMLRFAQADPRLVETLFAERGCWETVVGVSSVYEWDKLDTPQSWTFGCYQSALPKFNAPNLRCLHIVNRFWWTNLLPLYVISTSRQLSPDRALYFSNIPASGDYRSVCICTTVWQ